MMFSSLLGTRKSSCSPSLLRPYWVLLLGCRKEPANARPLSLADNQMANGISKWRFSRVQQDRNSSFPPAPAVRASISSSPGDWRILMCLGIRWRWSNELAACIALDRAKLSWLIPSLSVTAARPKLGLLLANDSPQLHTHWLRRTVSRRYSHG